MTWLQMLSGIGVFAVATCGVFLTVQPARPPARLTDVNAAEPSRHSCVDMNGKAFEWRSTNVPFAATCDAKSDAAK